MGAREQVARWMIEHSYATGHGDLTFALRASGVLARFRAAGGKILYMSNVDNVAATLDPRSELGHKV